MLAKGHKSLWTTQGHITLFRTWLLAMLLPAPTARTAYPGHVTGRCATRSVPTITRRRKHDRDPAVQTYDNKPSKKIRLVYLYG
ncbi:uncharacterized protein F5Z01DRAFT_510397 [Emericellopsis atlantica]|uniref:Secreted protein n=1 Tax=Emericellopsis atlantica TaxID=2614577 RepID=A0A9P7ZQN9_9HYPO|nr:uncharacterized protein F5Z01DRAFT_510397 [Emericellopsis atlantica]KAG9256435.1 hypothetical protein F5Z01DRAFT_510397 [Emericellopsis atlantica]